MPSPDSYHKPYSHTPDPYDDNDDDDDLDLTELDPHPTSSAPQRHSYDRGARIPLQNLRRFGGGRRGRRDEAAEDLEALVGGEGEGELGGKREGEPSDDDAPLLANGRALNPDMHELGSERRGYGVGRRGSEGGTSGWRRVWPFAFGRGRTEAGPIALPSASGEEADAEADDDPGATRTIPVGNMSTNRKNRTSRTTYPPNTTRNTKYTPLTFLPLTLFHEFKFFFNLYFLLVALSQILPALRIGYLSTYVAPLVFVLGVTLGKEAVDDLARRRRDGEANSEGVRCLRFEESGAFADGGGDRKRKVERLSERRRGKRRRLSLEEQEEGSRLTEAEREERATESLDTPSAQVTEVVKPSRDLRVGDVVVLGKDQRVPADLVILRSFATMESGNRKLGAAPPSYDPPRFTEDEGGRGGEGNGALLDTNAESDALRPDGRPKAAVDDMTTEDPSGSGEAFIRTDQLDGETDWKLRLASPLSQTLPPSEYGRLILTAGKPDKRVNDFVGTLELAPKTHSNHEEASNTSTPLTIDNTAWANTVLASSTTVYGVVVYTGPQTRAALSTSASRSKTGLLEDEINGLTKILCLLTAALSIALVALQKAESTSTAPSSNAAGSAGSGGIGEEGTQWYVLFTRFLILFSTIVPISLRVNLDMGKSVAAWFIQHDPSIPGTVVRTSTIPEELGRVEFLLTDKTGTLTRNEMVLRKVHVGSVGYGGEAMEEVNSFVEQVFGGGGQAGEEDPLLWTPGSGYGAQLTSATRTRREMGIRVVNLVLALALCHNVTPTVDEDAGEATTAYQASSPDEIAIVQWTEAVGLRVAHRDRRSLTLQRASDGKVVVRVEILQLFPFTSESKRMGVVVRFCSSLRGDDGEGEIMFLQKGADTVMSGIVAANDWLEEETGNMAREGLRTLVVGRKTLSAEAYAAFTSAYSAAGLSLANRDAALSRVIKTHLEKDLELLGVTGVEDKLQPNVKASLELLRNAGIKIWMLTGDKVETARCVAISSKLVARGQTIHTISNLTHKQAALDALGPLQQHNSHHPTTNTPNANAPALLIDGQSLALYLTHHRAAFLQTAVRLPAVIACRCSPTQKASLALLIRHTTRKRVACIGDGGNDVSMICAADVGVGIVGKEGKQASLAADFSVTQFAYLTKLLVWHGRNSYKRSAKLALFVIHRGLIAAVAQAAFSVLGGGRAVAVYRDWLLVGYATVYTMAPVFSLVLDRDVDEGLANFYPELYRELRRGRSLSYKTFFAWVGISVYQGLVVQVGSQVLVPGSSTLTASSSQPPTTADDLLQRLPTRRMISLSYSALIANELLMVACEVTTWHVLMILSLVGTAGAYIGSVPFLGGYYDLPWLLQLAFWWRWAALVAAAVGPVWVGKAVGRRVRPSGWRKVRGV